jgi:hypothetical protein
VGDTTPEEVVGKLTQYRGSVPVEHNGCIRLKDIIGTGIGDKLHCRPFLSFIIIAGSIEESNRFVFAEK